MTIADAAVTPSSQLSRAGIERTSIAPIQRIPVTLEIPTAFRFHALSDHQPENCQRTGWRVGYGRRGRSGGGRLCRLSGALSAARSRGLRAAGHGGSGVGVGTEADDERLIGAADAIARR